MVPLQIAPNVLRGAGFGFCQDACACFIGFTAVAMNVADAIYSQSVVTLPLLPETVAAVFFLEYLKDRCFALDVMATSFC